MVLVHRLIWDPGNVRHIARHQVSAAEVEQVCHGEHIQSVAYQGRIMLIGVTQQDRLLSVVLEPESEHTYYVVTARSASRKERQLYRSMKGGETA
jgi:uncharacterized DUF497 family protein